MAKPFIYYSLYPPISPWRQILGKVGNQWSNRFRSSMYELFSMSESARPCRTQYYLHCGPSRTVDAHPTPSTKLPKNHLKTVQISPSPIKNIPDTDANEPENYPKWTQNGTIGIKMSHLQYSD